MIHAISAAFYKIDIGSLTNKGREKLDRSFPTKSLRIYQPVDAVTFISGLIGMIVLNVSFSETMNFLNCSFMFFSSPLINTTIDC
jgi:hypothetical protein